MCIRETRNVFAHNSVIITSFMSKRDKNRIKNSDRMHEVVTNKNVHVDKYLIRLVWSNMAFLTLLNCDEERVKKRYWLSALPKYITHCLVLYRLLYLDYVTGDILVSVENAR